MTSEQRALHKSFLEFRDGFRECELEFLRLIQECDRVKLYKALGCTSLFKYVDVLAFSESVAYTYISVARKALEIPQLMESGLSVSKASRIVAALNLENAEELIRFALENPTTQIDREVARRNPKAVRERVKPLAEDCFELKIKASPEFMKILERVAALQAQRGQDPSVGMSIEAGLKEYLRRHDPVQKAERAKKKTSKKLCLNRVTSGRRPLTAQQKHAVFLRDQGRCTHVDLDGQRCNQDRWIDIHHVQAVSQGGSNEPDNLTTLCSTHHDLVHQYTFPIDGQVSWLREPIARCGT